MLDTPRSKAFTAGIQAELPILLGVMPFGMIYGALAIAAGIPPLAAQAMSAIVFAGSAQFVSTQLIHMAAPGMVIFLTVGVVNLRHALYSASIAPFVHRLSKGWKLLLAYLLTDEAYAVAITNYLNSSAPSPYQHWFFFGAGLALWTTWQLSTAAGILLGTVVPESWSLDFTLALTFIALVAPNLKGKPSLAAAVVAGIVAVAANPLPYKLGLFLAALSGILTGLLLERPKSSGKPGISPALEREQQA